MSSAELPKLPISPRIRKSPFFEATRRWGCQSYTVYNHMYLPVFYESSEADFWHLVKNVTLWGVAVERQVEITAEQRPAILDAIGTELIDRKAELGRLLAREEGKTLAEGTGEIGRSG